MRVSDVVDAAFVAIRKDFKGFFVWRIENFQVTPVPKEHYGKFYNGDSYIIYSASEKGKISKSNQKVGQCFGNLEIHIHFWIGNESSQDEAAVAAVKTVELDQFLGGTPIQHREAQGKESKRFHTYFVNGIRYLNGGVSTGFHHVKKSNEPLLYRVKGRRTVIVQQLQKVSWSEMNEGDVFILDCHTIIYMWTGKQSTVYEKLQGAKFSTTLKGEKTDARIIILEDGQEESLPDAEKYLFNEYLPIHEKNLGDVSAQSDDAYVRKLCSEMKLYQCSDENGTLKVVEMKKGPFLQSDLNSEDSFILDNGADGIWVWVGKKATRQEREEALRNAQGFITKKGYPHSTPVTRIVDGGEPEDFKTLFQDWTDKDETKGYTPIKTRNKLTTTVQTKFDASTLHQLPQISAQSQMVDEGDGQREVWRVHNFDLIEVPVSSYGEFYSGDCYVILYAYESETQKYIIYYWIGSHSSIDEAGTAALKTIELDDKLEGRAVQVRVCQGKEPPHFMAIFKGTMTIFNGGFASRFDGRYAKDVTHSDNYMLQVHGTSVHNTRAIEVEFKASSLNSCDCFVIVTPEATFVWCGKWSTGDEREVAKKLAATKGDVALISEGNEKNDFWNTLGGQEEYSKISPKVIARKVFHEPRLFQCSNVTGTFRVEEILDFNQDDLVEEDVMVLDSWHSIFIWIGRQSNALERQASEKLAFEYLRTDPAQRSPETPVYRIKQGYEPTNFTGYFPAWSKSNAVTRDLSQRLHDIAPDAMIIVTQNKATSNGYDPVTAYPIDSLQDSKNLPEGVDPTKREDYLSDSEFRKTFSMSRHDFEKLPNWRKLNLKKQVGLF